jgi:hypothetical protein
VRWRRILLAVNLALFTLLLGFVGGTGFVLKAAGWQRHNFIFDSAYLRIDPAESNAKMNLYFYHPSEPIASPPVLLYRGNEAAPVPVEAPRLPPVPAKDRQILHYDSRLFDPVDSWTASFFWSVAEHLKYGPFLLRAGADTHLILTLHTQKATRVRIGLKDDQGNEAKIDLSPIAGWGRYAIPLASFSGVDKNRIVFFSIAHESKLTPAGPDAPGDPEGRLHVQIAEIDFGSPGAGIAPTPTP